ncbi:MAG: hypothetical protein U0S12_00515 [Fimbriimonadales bacterium]
MNPIDRCGPLIEKRAGADDPIGEQVAVNAFSALAGKPPRHNSIMASVTLGRIAPGSMNGTWNRTIKSPTLFSPTSTTKLSARMTLPSGRGPTSTPITVAPGVASTRLTE